jgi:hypothetical protein
LPRFWNYNGHEGRTRREFEETLRGQKLDGQEKIVSDALEQISESEW